MKILVTGARGQLGSELQELSSTLAGAEWIFNDIGELDITSFHDLDAFVSKTRPDAIVNCAAYTAVDKAESNAETAANINVNAPSSLARLTNMYGFTLIHVSTDFVFDGTKSRPYTEDDPVRPLSVYGRTKAEGERAIIESAANYTIIRTSWLYSSYGSNFVKTIMHAASERGSLRVVFDQIGTPTYARDLAGAIIRILGHGKAGAKELYHYSNEGVASWYDFAVAICDLSEIKCPITPVTTEEYPTPAARPYYSVLDKGKIRRDFDIAIPYWRDSLRECIARIIEGESCVQTNH